MLKLPSLMEIRAERQRRSTRDAASGDLQSVRDRCRSLAGFVREAWPILEPNTPFVDGWVIKAICDHLEAITNGTFLRLGLSNRLLINVPPGMMKSLLVSVFWPAWEWGPAGMPSTRYLTTSYSEDYATRDSRKMRDLVRSDWYQSLWGSRVSLTRTGETSFANAEMGNREAMPFKSLTGGRGERLIIDDPHSTEDAESEADRKRAIRIFKESVPTRQNDAVTSAIVIIMQRLHEEDVSGTAISMGLGYVHLMLPMEFEPERRCVTPIFTDPRTEDGELLFPERFPRAVVERDKVPLGSYGVAGQFQQRPAPRGGLMFQRAWFRVVEAAPMGTRWVRGWDFAASTEDGSAETAGVKLGLQPGGRFLIGHALHGRFGPHDQKNVIVNTASQDARSVEISMPQDPGQAGKVQAADLLTALAGYLAYASVESGDKIDRARPVAAQAEAGNIDLLRGDWNEPFLAQLETFPTGKLKDMVDALSRAFGHLVTRPSAPFVSPVLMFSPNVHLGDHPDIGRS